MRAKSGLSIKAELVSVNLTVQNRPRNVQSLRKAVGPFMEYGGEIGRRVQYSA